MARRRVSAFGIAVLTGLMLGLREGTGLAPRPPLIVTEEVHWLSSGLDHEPDFDYRFGPVPEDKVGVDEGPNEGVPRGRMGALKSLIGRFLGRGSFLVLRGSSSASWPTDADAWGIRPEPLSQ